MRMRWPASYVVVILIGISVGFWLGVRSPFVVRPAKPITREPDTHIELPLGIIPSSPSPTPIHPSVTPSLPALPSERPQFVLLSFDGSFSLDMWDKSIAFARLMREKQKPLDFTYFISGVYFTRNQDRMKYHPPGLPAGTSSIGFGSDTADINARIDRVNSAVAEGHEIGTHFNGHFDGSSWTADEWESELSQFYSLVFTDDHKLTITANDIHGARTPVLGKNKNYFDVISKQGLTYDASATGKPDAWPHKIDANLWELPLAQITYIPTGTSILSMDYNFYFKQTGGHDTLTRDSPAWNKAYYAMYNSYIKYFNDNYAGTRAPVIIGHHFSLWNDGVYWDALKQFAFDVCGLPDVQCTTFSHVTDYLNQL